MSVNVFAMVTTRHSNNYTDYALASLIRHTSLQTDDEVILTDNDRAYPGLPEECRSRVRVLLNEQPRSFAANVNQMMDYAGQRRADILFLNNDLIFPPNWFEPLRPTGPFLLSPVSNGEVAYREGDFHCKHGMELQDYMGMEHCFHEIARKHQQQNRGYRCVLKFGFFAVKIPYEVYSVVGHMDESFGVGGGEDTDYCIRCHKLGFELRYAMSSYLLHFIGKSTWRGAESSEETAARDRVYSERFKKKWGRVLFALMIKDDISGLPPELRGHLEKGDFRGLIEQLRPAHLDRS